MGRLKTEQVIKRHEKAIEQRDLNRSIFEDAYDLIMPYRNKFTRPVEGSYNRPFKQFDSTGMIANNHFVNTMQSSFTPHFQRWAQLKSGPAVPDDQKPANDAALQQITDLIFTFLNASNFATSSAEMYSDLNIGTGVMYVLEGDEVQPLNFVPVPMGEVALEEGKFGRVEGIHRTHKVPARAIKATWKKAKLNEQLKRLIEDKPEEPVEFKESAYWDHEDLVWYYDIIHKPSNHRLVEREIAEDFILTPRWSKVPGIPFGIGPALMALADIKTINKMNELELKNAALSVFGVYTATDDAAINMNTATFTPGSIIPVSRNAGPSGPSIQPLPTAGDFQMQEFMMDRLQQQIKQTMLDKNLPPQSGPVRSATEIVERVQELQVNIGAAFGRLMFEFVYPLFRRVTAILERKKLIQLPKNFNIDNFFTEVEILSPIAQGQALSDVDKMIRSLGLTQQIDPRLVLTAFRIEDIPPWIAQKLGAPAKFVRDEEERRDLEERIAQLAAQTGQAQEQAASGQTPGGQNDGQTSVQF